MPHNDVFDDDEDHGEQLLGSLHLGPAEEEPVRRGAASRANSVRFDESALHGSNWGGTGNQSNRHSGEFGSIRPGSGLLMERTLSHKSDGRHSSAGHSVHSHHSVASGRASSIGLDTAADDDESFGVPEPPVSLYVLGSVPAIVRCWLTMDFAHGTLLYADICSGAQKSTISLALLQELDLTDGAERDVDGILRVRLNVYFAEAVVTQRGSRRETSGGLVPSMSVPFEVYNLASAESSSDRKAIGIFIGSDAVRAHSADVLFSQNIVVLYGNHRERLRVPFVRPEDNDAFRHLTTANVIPEKPKLNATAAPFVIRGLSQPADDEVRSQSGDGHSEAAEQPEPMSPTSQHVRVRDPSGTSASSEQGGESERSAARRGRSIGARSKDGEAQSRQKSRDASSGIQGSWRAGGEPGTDGAPRENAPISGYQPPPPRSNRGMKVLKASKSGSNSARTGASYEPPLPSRSEGRRKSQVSISGDSGNESKTWNLKRSKSSASEKSQSGRKSSQTERRSANPVGGASAFSWMTPTTKPSKSSAE